MRACGRRARAGLQPSRRRSHHSHRTARRSSTSAGVWCGCGVAASAGSSISLRDAQFVGEDSVLAGELARRAPAAPPAGSSAPVAEPYIRDIWELTMLPKPNDTRRYSVYDLGQNPTEKLASDLILKMMEQAVYATQYRLKEVDHITKRYESDPRFRIAYAFSQLEVWEKELHVMYSYATNKSEVRNNIIWFRVYYHIRYYTHGVKRMIDVTYTKDHIIDLSSQIINAQGEGLDMGN